MGSSTSFAAAARSRSRRLLGAVEPACMRELRRVGVGGAPGGGGAVMRDRFGRPRPKCAQ
eukprot:CAMPEP_0179917410 /NCGR_PEP_ID=MMETSP0983-20121128/2808_1 /TAXON_ID=483367 /ORGANISM="non described non described, Strain CCMP 2436" /LENGTH=59 /DNA_ID=CAMNT_0021820123 /DNA_START=342 /DNA_END=518 /DNA_ORIENTATION=-